MRRAPYQLYHPRRRDVDSVELNMRLKAQGLCYSVTKQLTQSVANEANFCKNPSEELTVSRSGTRVKETKSNLCSDHIKNVNVFKNGYFL